MNKNLSLNICTGFNRYTIRDLTKWQKIKWYFMHKKWESTNGIHCPRCGNKKLNSMISLSLKYCINCSYWFIVEK